MAAVLMVLAHAVDSWTADADRQTPPYYTLIFVAGLASPLFLFLAGVAQSMLASSRAARHGRHAAGAEAARRRGWEIFVLGLVFRVQAQLLGLGPLTNLLKVDMLNIMGVAMMVASRIWQALPRRSHRVAAFAMITAMVAMATPLVRHAPWLAPLPDPIEAYLRPAGQFGAFALFPWAGFLFAGVVVGELVDGQRAAAGRRAWPLNVGLALVAAITVVTAWMASFRPALYPQASFWHDSPTFFFIRLGIAIALIPSLLAVTTIVPERALAPLVVFGRSSLFVYWIHIELVYGVIAEPLKRGLPLSIALAATALLVAALYVVVELKNRALARHGLPGPWRVLAPVVR